MYPFISRLEAFFASVRAGGYLPNLAGVATFLLVKTATPGKTPDKVIHLFHTVYSSWLKA
jgi:hypothetical protein